MRKTLNREVYLPQSFANTPALVEAHKEITVLYLDEEKANRQAFQSHFSRYFTILTAGSFTKASRIVAKQAIAVLITEHRRAELTKPPFHTTPDAKLPAPIKILISEDTAAPSISSAISEGYLYRCYTKPWNDTILKEAIEDANSLYHANLELLERNKNLTKIKSSLQNTLENLLKAE